MFVKVNDIQKWEMRFSADAKMRHGTIKGNRTIVTVGVVNLMKA